MDMKRIGCALCVVIALLSPLQAFASEATEAAADDIVIEAADTAAAVPGTDEIEFTEDDASDGETALPPAEEPAGESETPQAEEPAGEADAASEEAEEIELPPEELWDEEDPLALRFGPQALALDGASTGKTHANFVPRALNNEVLHKGIDVSNWQGDIDWSAVAASGVDFVFVRAAHRTVSLGNLLMDSRFAQNMRGAKAAGLKVGVYIFSQAITTAEAVEEAEYLLNAVKGYSVDLPLVFDLEHYYTSTTTGRFTAAKLSKRAVTDICKAFCARIEQAGYESMVYSNPSMLNNEMYASELGKLWLAHYTAKTSYSGHAYEYWQCGIGVVPGISGDCDLDFWFEPYSGPFSDVKKNDWFYDSVLKAYDAKVVSGMTASTFSPYGTATRAQFVTMLYRLEGSPSWSEQAAFEDLTQDYYKDAVYWAAESGVTSGVSETAFGPDQSISREQLVTLLYRLEGSPETEKELDDYSDAQSVHDYARAAMAWAVEEEIVSGYEDATLRPQKSATRAEVCAILMRYDALSD